MKVTWEVDDRTVVMANFGAFGREIISVNGSEVLRRRSLSRRGSRSFQLPDGRGGTINLEPELIGQPTVELRIDGRLYAATTKEKLTCPKCRAAVKPNDRFCDGCGNALPGPEHRQHQKQLANATGAIGVLAGLFGIFGTLMFFVTRSTAQKALGELASLDANVTLPIDGVPQTVASLREQIMWEPWGVLAVNWVLAAIMVGLALWSKRSPLPAVLVAAATYAAVIVVNGILEPATIAQGIIMKIIIIAFLFKGIKAALALRGANA